MHKRLFLATALAVSICSLAQAQDTSCGIIWYPPIQLSDSGHSAYQPTLSLSGYDTIHVSWWEDVPPGVRLPYTRSVSAGMNFEPVKEMLPDAIAFPDKAHHPFILSIGMDVFLFFSTGTRSPIRMRHSGDGGETFSSVIDLNTEQVARVFHATNYNNDFVLHYPKSSKERRLLRSWDGAMSWTTVVINSDEATRFALTPGRLHLVQKAWLPPAAEVEYRRSTNLGDTWEKQEIISDVDVYWSDLPTIAGSESECGTELLTAWRDVKYGGFGIFGASIISRSSLSGGSTWLPEMRVSTERKYSAPKASLRGGVRAIATFKEVTVFDTLHAAVSASNNSLWNYPPFFDLTPVASTAGNQAVAVTAKAVHVVYEQETAPGGSFRIYYRRGEFIQRNALLSLPTGWLTMDTTEIYRTSTRTIAIQNSGTDPLVVGTVVADNPASFTAIPESVTVAPSDSAIVTIRFHPTSIGSHSGRIVFYHNGQSSPDCFTVSGEAVYRLDTVRYTPAGVWQMVSLPVRPAQSYSLPSLFSYEGNYQRQSSMTFGKGYWAKPSDEEKAYRGLYTTRDSIPVQAGWNMIGSVSEAVLTSTITSSPPAMSVSSFYSYNPSKGSYTVSDFIEPGRAYWVRTSQSGKFYLSEEATTRFGAIRIDRSATEQPPAPPPEATNTEDRTSDIPQSFSLAQNYPNPFNPVTEIGFGIPVSGFVSLKVYDVLGREVATLVDGIRDAGYGKVQWDASTLSGGVYYVRMRAGEFTETRAAVVMK